MLDQEKIEAILQHLSHQNPAQCLWAIGIQFTSCSLKPKFACHSLLDKCNPLVTGWRGFSTGLIVSTCFWNTFMCFHMLFLKSKSSLIAAVEMNIHEVEATRGDLPLLYNPEGGCGAGDVFPSWNEGRKTSSVLLGSPGTGCLHCLSSCPSWSSSAFSTSHRKVGLFECLGNNSSTHWCQKYKLITGGAKCFAS